MALSKPMSGHTDSPCSKIRTDKVPNRCPRADASSNRSYLRTANHHNRRGHTIPEYSPKHSCSCCSDDRDRSNKDHPDRCSNFDIARRKFSDNDSDNSCRDMSPPGRNRRARSLPANFLDSMLHCLHKEPSAPRPC